MSNRKKKRLTPKFSVISNTLEYKYPGVRKSHRRSTIYILSVCIDNLVKCKNIYWYIDVLEKDLIKLLEKCLYNQNPSFQILLIC